MAEEKKWLRKKIKEKRLRVIPGLSILYYYCVRGKELSFVVVVDIPDLAAMTQTAENVAAAASCPHAAEQATPLEVSFPHASQ